MRGHLRVLLLALGMALVCPATAATAPTTAPGTRPPATRAASAEPEWSAIFLDDVKVGFSRMRRTESGQEVRYDLEEAITLERQGISIELRLRQQTAETLDGRPLRFRHSMQLGQGRQQVTSGTVRDGQIDLAPTTPGAEPRVVPYPEGALLPEGVRLEQMAKGLAPGTTYSLAEFEPMGLSAVRQDITVGTPEDVAIIGRTVRLAPLRTVVHHGGAKLEGITYVDADYRGLKSEFSILGMKLTMVACDEAYANSPNGKFDPVKVTAPASPVAIERPRSVRAASFTLAPLDPKAPLVVPGLDGQEVRQNSDGTLTVRVRLVEPSPGTVPAATRPYAGDDPEARAALKPSAYVQSDHRDIRLQAAQIVEGIDDPLAGARAIEQWAHQRVSRRSLSVGYASALETLKSRAGDCTEHAVLTAALCRAAGVPCRLVLGVAYAETFGDLKQRFIGHAWNQAYVGGRWVTLDAALGPDAARIALLVGAEDPASFIGLLQSLGNFKVVSLEVQEVTPEEAQ